MATARARAIDSVNDSARPHLWMVAGILFLMILLQMAAPARLGPFGATPQPAVESCMACTGASDLVACHKLAMDLAVENDHRQAIAIEERIHRLDPQNAEVAAALARMYHVGRNDTVRAIKFYHAALGAVSGYPPALFGLGTIMEEKGDLAIAERYFSRGSREHPDMMPFKVRLAELLVRLGREDEAAPVFQEIIARWPDSDEAGKARRMMTGTALARP